jgi:hypothetical protein
MSFIEKCQHVIDDMCHKMFFVDMLVYIYISMTCDFFYLCIYICENRLLIVHASVFVVGLYLITFFR